MISSWSAIAWSGQSARTGRSLPFPLIPVFPAVDMCVPTLQRRCAGPREHGRRRLRGHALKFGADFNKVSDLAKWDLFFPARVIFASLGGPSVAGPTFLNQTPVVFWFPLVNAGGQRT
jgi:hypothetical protein